MTSLSNRPVWQEPSDLTGARPHTLQEKRQPMNQGGRVVNGAVIHDIREQQIHQDGYFIGNPSGDISRTSLTILKYS